MQKSRVNYELALEILFQIHSGNRSFEDVDSIFYGREDFSTTMSALSVESNADGIIELQRPNYVYVVKGTSSDVWPTMIHSFLKQYGYQSKFSHQFSGVDLVPL